MRGFSLRARARDGAASLSVPQQQVQLDAPGMLAETDEYMAGGKRPARVYRVVNGIAVSAGDRHAGAPAGRYAAIFRNDRL